jgi:hypothetical protein
VAEALRAAHGSERGLGDVIPTARELAGMGIRGSEVGGAVWQGKMVPARGWWGLGGGLEVKQHSSSGVAAGGREIPWRRRGAELRRGGRREMKMGTCLQNQKSLGGCL